MRLVFANRSVDDILLRSELDALAAARPDVFSVYYTVDAAGAPPDWRYGARRVDEAMLSEHLLAPGDGSIVAMCGPPGMIEHACLPALARLGHAPEALIQF